jgi:hypothetical protein
MAKTTTVTGKLDIVDLIRKRDRFPLLNVPPCRVVVTFEVTTTALLVTPAPAPSAKMDRMKQAAQTKLNEYENIITEECARFSVKIDGLLKEGKQKEAEAVVQAVNASINKALDSAKGAATQAVEDAKEKESQGDKLLTEARVKTTVTVVFKGVSLAANVSKLAASHGADVTSYVSIAKTVVDLAMILQQQLKTEPTLREDLKKGLEAYIKLRDVEVVKSSKACGLTDFLPRRWSKPGRRLPKEKMRAKSPPTSNSFWSVGLRPNLTVSRLHAKRIAKTPPKCGTTWIRFPSRPTS